MLIPVKQDFDIPTFWRERRKLHQYTTIEAWYWSQEYTRCQDSKNVFMPLTLPKERQDASQADEMIARDFFKNYFNKRGKEL